MKCTQCLSGYECIEDLSFSVLDNEFGDRDAKYFADILEVKYTS